MNFFSIAQFRPAGGRAGLPARALAGIILGMISPAWAQLPSLGSETLAHTASAVTQHEVSSAVDQAGNYVVTWSGIDASNNSGIFVQRFNRRGQPLGSAVQAHVATAGVQQHAAVAMANDGRFVVAWEDNAARGGNNFDVFYRLYDASGSPAGATASADVRVNATASGVRENPRVSMNRNTGEFVIVFAGGDDQSSVEPYYRRYNASGTALDGSDVRVNALAANNLNYTPSVGLSTNGTFVVAWEGDPDGDNAYEILYRTFVFSTGAAGTGSSGNRSALSLSGQDPTNADVAIENDGSFVITWTKNLRTIGTDTSDLLFRRFDASGNAQGTEVAFETGASGGGDTVARSRVAMEDDGDFVIVWNNSNGDPANNESYIRFYGANGTAKGAEALINATTAGAQTRPRVAINPNGNRCVAVFSGNGTGDSNGAFFRRYAENNVAPTLAAIGSRNVNEGSALSFTASATEGATNFGDTITYSLSAGFPAGAAINSSTGAFSWTPTEAQGPGSYNITVVATDDGEPSNLSDSETIAVSVAELNQAPSAPILTGNTVTENSPSGTTVGTLSATDADQPAQTLTYSLVSGTGSTDNGRFAISGTSLRISEVPDFETKSSYSVRVRVTDNGTPAQSNEQIFTVNVTNVDDSAPASTASVVDNTLAGTSQISVQFAASDTESSGLASTALYVKTPGSGSFSATGTPQTGTSGSFSYTAAADGVYEFYTRATDNAANVEAVPGTPDVRVTINLDANSSLSLTAASQSGSLVFPMTSTLNATLVLSGAAIGDSFEVSRITPLGGTQPAYFRQPGMLLNEALSVSHSGPGSFTADLQWAYDPANASGLGASPLNTAYKFTGGAEPQLTWSVTPSAGVITVPGLTSFSTFYAGNATAVPVSVSGFCVE